MTIRIYTDGSCRPNPGSGGWGAVVLVGKNPPIELSGNTSETTSNRMELTAAIEALKEQPAGSRVEIYTDSQYLRNGVTDWVREWIRSSYRTRGRKKLKNADLWRALAMQIDRCDVRWNWVKAHAGDVWNERADALARSAIPAPEDPMAGAPNKPDLATVHAFLGIAHSAANPRSGLGVILQFGPHTKEIHRSIDDVESPNQMHLHAALEALVALRRAVPIEIHTTADYLANGATQWLPGWRSRGWRTKSGEPVKHRELWERLGKLLETNQASFVVVPRKNRVGPMAAAKDLARACQSTEHPNATAEISKNPSDAAPRRLLESEQ